MKTLRREIVFLGLASILLLGCVTPNLGALEDDDGQISSAMAVVAGPSSILASARGKLHPRAQTCDAVLPASCTTSVGHAAERVSDFFFRNCRSILQSFCSLRC